MSELYSAEKELVLAIGSTNDVPKWARPAVKYFRHPAEHGLNLTIADFPPADTPSAVERYNAWMEKKKVEKKENVPVLRLK